MIVAAFPPPLHGQSAVNAKVNVAAAALASVDRKSCNISPGNHDGYSYHISRLRRVISACMHLFIERIRCRRAATAYFVLEAGHGIIYNFLLIAIARILAYDIVLHHHSSAHTSRRSRPFSFLSAVAGRRALHVVLCNRMRVDLQSLYPRVGRCIVSSNVTHIPLGKVHANTVKARAEGFKMGLLSNLTIEKGAIRAVDVAIELSRRGVACSLDLAGPCNDSRIFHSANSASARYTGSVRMLGPVHGVEKENFFNNIDVFLFPSFYRNEAQPLVVLEALSHGVPVIVSSHGYTPDVVPVADWVCPAEADYMEFAVELISKFISDDRLYFRACEQAQKAYESLLLESQAGFKDLIDSIS